MARLLSEELGRPVEAVLALAPWLGARPPIPAALDMAKRVLSEPSVRAEVAERLEHLANGGDEEIAVGIFGFLVEARGETAGMTESRCRWWRRLVELKS